MIEFLSNGLVGLTVSGRYLVLEFALSHIKNHSSYDVTSKPHRTYPPPTYGLAWNRQSSSMVHQPPYAA